jgi:hypothetical protein
MTLDVYSHLWPDSEDRSRTSIDAFLGAPPDSTATVEATVQVRGFFTDSLEKE